MRSRMLSWVARVVALACSIGASGHVARAQSPAPHVVVARLPAAPPAEPAEDVGLSRTVFWVAASATIITASLGGFYALHVKDLYDEANLQPLVSPERGRIRGEMETAEVTADVLLLGSVAMLIGTTVLSFYIDWSGKDRPPQPTAAVPARRSWW